MYQRISFLLLQKMNGATPLIQNPHICIMMIRTQFERKERMLSLATSLGTIIFFRRGVPNSFKKIGVNKIATPLFRQQKFYDPITDTPYPLNRLNWLKSVFLNKINTLSVVILWLPTFWSLKKKKKLCPPIFLSKNLMTPSIFGTPIPKIKKMIAHTLFLFSYKVRLLLVNKWF